jgi:predicted chitinase/N-acetyl-anhydromuramyl-L-alanine amidase AmpD
MTAEPDVLQFVLPMMRGGTVRAVQTALALRGFLPPDGADGLYGPQTRNAVAAFQRSARLAETGVVDGGTRAALLASAEPTARGAGSEDLAPLRRRQTEEVVPPDRLPDARPARVILHWTAGGHRASALDCEHYHFMVEATGDIVPGRFTIADNDSTGDGRYAAHVRGKNTRSVGVALCGMANARERPFHAGTAPIVPLQLDRMAALVAQICARYDIPVSRETVLGHGEVQEVLGAPQTGKWDPLVLPWRLDLSQREVGDHLRALVAARLTGLAAEADPEARRLALTIAGTEIPGGAFASDGLAWVEIDRLATAMGWQVVGVDDGQVRLMAGERLAMLRLGFPPEADEATDAVRGAVRLDALAEQLDLGIAFADDRVILDGAVGGTTETIGADGFRRVTVGSGETLSAIARRELSSSAAWTSIRQSDGSPFTDEAARRLRPGEQVLVPATDPAAPVAPVSAAPADEADLERIADLVAVETHSANRAKAIEVVPRLLRACLAQGITDPSHLGYVLATAEHETNFGRSMVEKWTNSEAQLAYGRSKLNSGESDGKTFLGRGYVQLTFRSNYRRFGEALGAQLETQPNLAADPDIAAQVMALGMCRLGYCSPKKVLATYGEGRRFDFEGARAIVNGDRDRFEERYGTTVGIAVGRQARKFAEIIAEVLPPPAP